MAGLRLNNAVRVLQLYAGDTPHHRSADILTAAPTIEYLGSFDILQSPYDRVRALDPHVVLLQLPIPALQVLRWINYLRTALHSGAIIVLERPTDKFDRQSGLASGIEHFISEEQLPRRLPQAIQRAYQKHNPTPAQRRIP